MSEAKKKSRFKSDRTASTIIIAIGVTVFLLSILFKLTPIYVLMISALSSMATYELIHSVGCKNKIVIGVASVVSFATNFMVGYGIEVPYLKLIMTFYVLFMLSLSVFLYKKDVKFVDTIIAIFASTAIPYGFSCFLRIYHIGSIMKGYSENEGLFLVIFALSSAWATDSFAYLVGKRIGKHKMSPTISPKKSIEGAIGGIILSAIANVFFLFIFTVFFKIIRDDNLFKLGAEKYLYIIPFCLFFSVVSMIGDLTASAFKRNIGIKDFSNILPGHGGILDRFDSSMFVLPIMYGMFEVVANIK